MPIHTHCFSLTCRKPIVLEEKVVGFAEHGEFVTRYAGMEPAINDFDSMVRAQILKINIDLLRRLQQAQAAAEGEEGEPAAAEGVFVAKYTPSAREGGEERLVAFCCREHLTAYIAAGTVPGAAAAEVVDPDEGLVARWKRKATAVFTRADANEIPSSAQLIDGSKLEGIVNWNESTADTEVLKRACSALSVQKAQLLSGRGQVATIQETPMDERTGLLNGRPRMSRTQRVGHFMWDHKFELLSFIFFAIIIGLVAYIVTLKERLSALAAFGYTNSFASAEDPTGLCDRIQDMINFFGSYYSQMAAKGTHTAPTMENLSAQLVRTYPNSTINQIDVFTTSMNCIRNMTGGERLYQQYYAAGAKPSLMLIGDIMQFLKDQLAATLSRGLR